MAIQLIHTTSNKLHMYSTVGDCKDINADFSDRGNNPDNKSINVSELPNLPAFQESVNMTNNNSEADIVRTSHMTGWTRKHPQKWSQKDVLDWAYCVVEQERLDGSKFKGEAYRDFAGSDLCGMDRDQFQKVDPCYGTIIYDNLQYLVLQESLKNENYTVDSRRRNLPGVFNSNFIEHCWIDGNKNNYYNNNNNSNNNNNNNINMNEEVRLVYRDIDYCDNSNRRSSSDLTVLRSDNDFNVDLPSLGVYPISREFELPLSAFSRSTLPSQPSPLLQHQVSISSPLKVSCIPQIIPWTLAPSVDSAEKFVSMFGMASSSTTAQCRTSPSTTSSARSPNFQTFQSYPSVSSSTSQSKFGSSLLRNSSASTIDSNDLGYSSEDSTCSLSFMPPMASPQCGNAFCNEDMDPGINSCSTQKTHKEASQDGRNDKRHVAAKTSNQLWKFVLELLRDPETNPRLLKWEDRNSGVFRFVQSEKVARLWGQKKNNPQMTYEKMSRAMRFCRSIGYFSEIDKDGRFPKKLCFKFGVKSQGWRD